MVSQPDKKKGFSQTRFLAICLLLLICLFVSSCIKKEKVLTDQELYNNAQEYLGKEKFRKAGEIFKQLEEEHPESPLMAKTRLNRADCHFKLKEYDLAREEYERFLNLHPLHPNADIARFRIAMTFFSQILGTDRDQSITAKALEGFERFLKEYPQSELVQQVKEKLSECRLRLAEHDLYVARFYLKTGSFRAARGRLRKVWTLYPDVPKKDEVLYLLSQTYRMEGMVDEAGEVLSTLCLEFPASPFIKKIQGSCQKLGLEDLQ